MATFQDTFDNDNDINEHIGTETTGGELINEDIDEGAYLEFDGSATQISSGSDTSIDNIFTGGGTILWRGKINSDGEGNAGRIAAKRSGANGWRFFVQNEATGFVNINFGAGFSSVNGVWVTDVVVPVGQWISVALTYNSSSVSNDPTIYINGVVSPVTESSTPSGSVNTDAAQTLLIGEETSDHFDGAMSELELHDAILSKNAIQQWSSANVAVSTTNQQLWHKFDEGTGTSLTDSSSNSNTGTITSGTWVTSETDIYTLDSRATSTDVLDGLSATAVNSWAYTLGKKSGGRRGVVQFSDDNFTTTKNSNNDTLAYGAYEFDGVNDEINCGSGSTIDNLFDSGGTIMSWVKLRSDGEGNAGRILDKDNGSTGWFLAADSQVENVVGLRFRHKFSGTNGTWDTQDKFPLGQWVHLAVTYNNSSTSNNPIIYINGISADFTEVDTPTGTRSDDSAINFCIGNRDDTAFTTDGFTGPAMAYKRILSASEIIDYVKNGVVPSSTSIAGDWQFNGNANDGSGNGNNGTVTGAVNTTNWYETPHLGDSLIEDDDVLGFDGVNDRVTVTDAAAIDFGTGSFTVYASVKTVGTTAEIVSKVTSTSGNAGWRLSIGTDGTAEARIEDASANTVAINSAAIINDDRWHTVALVVDRSSNVMRMYIDGDLEVTSASISSVGTVDNSIDLQIGRNANNSRYFDGGITNVTLFDDIRTATEIETDYKNGYVGTAEGNLVAYYPLNEGTGTTADNAEGTASLDGTITGATWTTDIYRPLALDGTQQTISLSALSYTSSLYYRTYHFSNNDVYGGVISLEEMTVDYTASATRRIFNIS